MGLQDINSYIIILFQFVNFGTQIKLAKRLRLPLAFCFYINICLTRGYKTFSSEYACENYVDEINKARFPLKTVRNEISRIHLVDSLNCVLCT